MLASTLLAIPFVPVFFVVIRHARRAATTAPEASELSPRPAG